MMICRLGRNWRWVISGGRYSPLSCQCTRLKVCQAPEGRPEKTQGLSYQAIPSHSNSSKNYSRSLWWIAPKQKSVFLRIYTETVIQYNSCSLSHFLENALQTHSYHSRKWLPALSLPICSISYSSWSSTPQSVGKSRITRSSVSSLQPDRDSENRFPVSLPPSVVRNISSPL